MGLSRICCFDSEFSERAQALAERWRLPLEAELGEGLSLVFDSQGLRLEENKLSMQVDFVGGALGFRRQQGEGESLLMKAVGAKNNLRPQVWDMTAGLGQDSFILASRGCEVQSVERHPVVFELLSDGLRRAALAIEDDALQSALSRWTCHCGQAQTYPTAFTGKEVIYLDPMFPERRKSAKVKKNMQLLQRLLDDGEADDADQLFEWAMSMDVARVVVKRPRIAPPLGSGQVPLQFSGKAVRFDVYPKKSLSYPVASP